MWTVKQVSKLTGISVRTLHYYDSINLLKPSALTESGYRLYDYEALKKLHSILLFRELKFSLKEIKSILDSENIDYSKILDNQINLLKLQLNHTKKLLDFACELKEKGVDKMEFEIFDKTEIENYKKEAKEKWGHTKEYKEFEEKQKNNNYSTINIQLMSIFNDIGKLKNLPADNIKVQEKIKHLQDFITDNFYTCTHEILSQLGNMYVSDTRFKNNIDKTSGIGTAEFTKQAIDIYCSKK